jgi:hypothetical protein
MFQEVAEQGCLSASGDPSHYDQTGTGSLPPVRESLRR